MLLQHSTSWLLLLTVMLLSAPACNSWWLWGGEEEEPPTAAAPETDTALPVDGGEILGENGKAHDDTLSEDVTVGDTPGKDFEAVDARGDNVKADDFFTSDADQPVIRETLEDNDAKEETDATIVKDDETDAG